MLSVLQGICQLITFYANKTEQRSSSENFFAEGENMYALNPQVSMCCNLQLLVNALRL